MSIQEEKSPNSIINEVIDHLNSDQAARKHGKISANRVHDDVFATYTRKDGKIVSAKINAIEAITALMDNHGFPLKTATDEIIDAIRGETS